MIPKQPCGIIAGPSKFDLMVSLFDRSSATTRTVQFTLADNEQVEVVVNGIEVESGSGDAWILKGYRLHRTQHAATPSNVVGYYNTQVRKGWLQLI